MSTTPADLAAARVELNRRCDAVEECCEYLRAYAGQGLSSESCDGAASQIREHLGKCDTALTGLAQFVSGFVACLTVASAEPYAAFVSVIERDAKDALAAVRLVLAQTSISSQLVGNLNASIHLRALLTDLFLIDEALKSHRRAE